MDLIRRHPLFAPLAHRAVWNASQGDDQCPPDGWALVTSLGYVYLNPQRRDGPILIITDAWIDRVRIKRDHAFLIPAGAVLPFPARGPVFRFS